MTLLVDKPIFVILSPNDWIVSNHKMHIFPASCSQKRKFAKYVHTYYIAWHTHAEYFGLIARLDLGVNFSENTTQIAYEPDTGYVATACGVNWQHRNS